MTDTAILTNDQAQQLPFSSAFNCDQCSRAFISAPALRMHKIRKHSGKGWSTTANLRRKTKAKPQYPSSDPEYKKRKYKETQARYSALGLNAHGEPFKTKWGKRISAQRRGVPRGRKVPKNKRIEPIVYYGEQAQPETPKVSSIKHCPYCGENIEKHL